jgi:hypothetical protein
MQVKQAVMKSIAAFQLLLYAYQHPATVRLQYDELAVTASSWQCQRSPSVAH